MLTADGRFTVQLVSTLIGLPLTKQESMLLSVYSETTESKPIKPETSCTVNLPPAVSVLCLEKHKPRANSFNLG